MKWNEEQFDAINSRGQNLLVSAAAGSGKTAVLTERVVKLAAEGTDLDRMLIITFTNAAAAEMRERILRTGGVSVLAVKDIYGEYDYWYFAGYSGNGSNYNGRSSNAKNTALETWSNAVSNADNKAFGRAAVLEYGYWSTQRLFNDRHSAQRAYRYPVRCQKID